MGNENSKLLSKEEIDALLSPNKAAGESVPETQLLTTVEKDALGEIGNISIGSAATTLSILLNQRVQISGPQVLIMSGSELWSRFESPYMTIKVQYKDGFNGYNLLILKLQEALTVADLMMGGDGSVQIKEPSEMEISAASEAMNQMSGSAATALAMMLGRTINISPPQANIFKEGEVPEGILEKGPLAIVLFNMTVGSITDFQIMQIMSPKTAKEEIQLLLSNLGLEVSEHDFNNKTEEIVTPPDLKNDVDDFITEGFFKRQEKIPAMSEQKLFPLSEVEQEKLNLILDIPLKVTVVLGKTKKPIKEVLGLTPGSIIELNSLAEEPVDILVNGTLVAKGEVVVVNENFGVRINNIISPQERIQNIVK
ncbi:flagellar motor switch phosphatase FliY [Desulfolucanica intricata]|uniref:flagellar motor switch phosphatase FliY n=1 Tax=Desulfolucanica intricata TaxID=1285191 RepID=UPI00083411B2|nr:flagellar motor switch phosphatase FliY [Desulfolucanica intricata]